MAHAQASRPGSIGLALAGGGFLGAAYELGALCALAESVDGLDLTRLDVYVGVSAGSFLAAGLANGIAAHRMMRMFVEGDDAEVDFEPAHLIEPATAQWRRALHSAPAGFVESAHAALEGGWRAPQAAFWRALDRSLRILPNGLIDAAPAERRLAALFSHKTRTNDFRRLPARLRIVAADIDSGEPVAFGSPGHDQVPISHAAIASSALPGLFAPVRIGGRHYVDGILNKTLHASMALDAGAGLVLCVNPLVPYSGAGAQRRVSRSGIQAVLSQTLRTAIRSRMSVGLEKYGATHPSADIVLFEPHRDDAEFFFANIFSVASRRHLCEHAYESTRADLLARADALEPVLRRHGLALNRAVLTRPAPPLVRLPRRRSRAVRETRATQALQRLRRTLDDLERALAIAAARRSDAPA